MVKLASGLILVMATAVSGPQKPIGEAVRRHASPRISEAYGRVPLAFEANTGQSDPQVRFLSRGPGYTLFLARTEAVLSLRGPSASSATNTTGPADPQSEGAVLRMKMLGANRKSTVTGGRELPGRTNYLVGSDPKAWHTGIRSYAEVRYAQIYPGVDLVFHGSTQGELEYDFVLGAGADPRALRIGFEGASGLELDDAGNLVIHTGAGDVIERAPVAYQEIGGARRPVATRFELGGKHEVRFRVGEYDRRRPLIIDPTLVYSTYLGGSGFDLSAGVTVDSAGSAYVTGRTESPNFPTTFSLPGPKNPNPNAGGVTVTKLSPAGSSLVYSTYVGGTGISANARGLAVAVDGAGSVYVTGQTCSADFPTVNPAQAAFAGGSCDAFVAKLSPAGDALVYSTFLGGTCREFGAGIAVDAVGQAYVGGMTGGNPSSGVVCPTGGSNFPVVNAFQGTHGGREDGFVVKLSPTGSQLLFSTYLGGTEDDAVRGIALGGSENVYVAGSTRSVNFPTLGSLQSCGNDAFVTRFAPGGGTLVYSTCLGSPLCVDAAHDVAVDGSGHAYVAGRTDCASGFPVVNAVQSAGGGGVDAFVAKLAPMGSSLVYATYLGGNGEDVANGIALDAAGAAHVTGQTGSANFPVVNAVQSTKGQSIDAFVTKLVPDGSSLEHSTFFGGSDATLNDHRDFGNRIAVDAAGNAYAVGQTGSTDLPMVNAFQPTRGGAVDGFIVKIAPDQPPAVTPTANAGADQAADEGATVALDGRASSDPNGDSLSYQWQQVAGPPAGLSDTTSPVLTFTAPGVPSGGATLTFQLTVSDGVHTSTPDTVDITIRNVNQAPVADAGGDQTVREGSLVTLHAGDSFDPDSDALTYQWTQIAGAPVSLSDPAVAQPTFTAPTVGSGGDTLRFVVTVGDGTAASTDEVAIVVTNLNQTPIANAGSDQTVDAGTAVTLSAAASTDPDGDALIYSWTQVSGPLVALSGADSALARFTAPAAGPNGGTLVFQLTVGDGSSVGEPDTVTVTVRDANQPPSCDRAVASPKRLWPPNHRFTPVRITGIADPNDRRVRVTITSVTQSEPVSGHGDCGTSPDALVHGKHLLLRAERDGHGTGRIYDVTFKATDAKGAACTGTVSVCVPHDRRGACIDTGKRYNSLSR